MSSTCTLAVKAAPARPCWAALGVAPGFSCTSGDMPHDRSCTGLCAQLQLQLSSDMHLHSSCTGLGPATGARHMLLRQGWWLLQGAQAAGL